MMLGNDIKMFSRIGKTSAAHHQVFSDHRKSSFKYGVDEDDNDNEYFLDEKKLTDIEGELRKIERLEKEAGYASTDH